MGIESDKLVYDYLSRVGDIAQQRSLPSSQRMRLVSQLRERIDRLRAEEGADSTAAVRQLLARFGDPDEIVAAVGDDPAKGAPEAAPRPAAPSGLAGRLPRPRAGGGAGRRLPRPRGGELPKAPAAPVVPEYPEPSPTAASPPHLAGEDELDLTESGPDWWRVEPGPFGAGGGRGRSGLPGETVPGFTGGIELPEILEPPPREDEEPRPGPAEDAADEDEEEAEEEYARARPVWELLRSSGPVGALAVLALLAGAVLGMWQPVLAGWLLVYASRRLSRTEAKWAVLGIPGTVAAGAVVWLWGRANGRWGEPIAKDGFNAAAEGAYPWVVRIAALASAAYLLWRARRRAL